MGALAGIAEPSEENLNNIDRALDAFRQAGVSIIVVVGGVGKTEKEMGPVLERLSQAPVPTLLVPGAQESFDELRRAIARVSDAYPQLIDMTRVRRLRIGGITLLSLPGHHNPFYLEAKERGCAYIDKDVEATLALAEEKRDNVLLSPAPPRGVGPEAVDRARGDVNIGDPLLAGALAKSSVAFGIYGYVYESAGHATLSDGVTVVPEGVASSSLMLQVGSAEAVPLTLSSGGRVAGVAQIVEIAGGSAKFRTISLVPSRVSNES
jgi:Icc-related predicted phosphoesterase